MFSFCSYLPAPALSFVRRPARPPGPGGLVFLQRPDVPLARSRGEQMAKDSLSFEENAVIIFLTTLPVLVRSVQSELVTFPCSQFLQVLLWQHLIHS